MNTYEVRKEAEMAEENKLEVSLRADEVGEMVEVVNESGTEAGLDVDTARSGNYKNINLLLLIGSIFLIGVALWATVYGVKQDFLIPASAIARQSGFRYTADLPTPNYWLFESLTDSPNRPKSETELFEDNKPLGPTHSLHDDILELGLGRFSHWGSTLYFSTSDNSDPRTNGRFYKVVITATAPAWIWAVVLPCLLISLYLNRQMVNRYVHPRVLARAVPAMLLYSTKRRRLSQLRIKRVLTHSALISSSINTEFLYLPLIDRLTAEHSHQSSHWKRRWGQRFDWVAVSASRSIALVGLTALFVITFMACFGHLQPPSTHDEFSYLLASDTFAHGRLTNPPHPMWVHFESMHIIQQPTYASKYPVGQGLLLALGQVLTGYPIVGVWLSIVLACLATGWMLRAWLPPRWALLGGLLTTIHPLVLHWSQNYWGGAVAMSGGALLLGAFPRILREMRVQDGVVMGIGMGILANSRPYEGLVLSLLVSVSLLAWTLHRNSHTIRIFFRHVILPVFIVLASVGTVMGYYNFKVTGHPLLMPYQVHEKAYNVSQVFLWQSPPPTPIYRHKAIADLFYTDPESRYHPFHNFFHKSWKKIKEEYAWYWLNLGWLLPLVILPWMLQRDRWMRLALLMVSVFLAALTMEVYAHAHYAAPIMALIPAITAQALRHLWKLRLTGRLLMSASLVLCVVTFVNWSHDWISKPDPKNMSGVLQREQIIASLKRDGGKHLIIVRYAPNHSPHQEWVYNEADIDHAPVVWAREMDEEQNRKLLDYFRSRRAWLLEADAKLPSLVPYPLSLEFSRKTE